MSENPPNPSKPGAGPAGAVDARPPEHVVALAALGIAEDLVRLVDLLEPLLGLRLGVDVRVPLLGELAEGALDLGVASRRARRRGPGSSRVLWWPCEVTGYGRRRIGSTGGAARYAGPVPSRLERPDDRRAPPDRRAHVRPRRDLRFGASRRSPGQALARRVRTARGRATDPRAARSRTDPVDLVRAGPHHGHVPGLGQRHRRRRPRDRLPRLVSRGLRDARARGAGRDPATLRRGGRGQDRGAAVGASGHRTGRSGRGRSRSSRPPGSPTTRR